MYETKKRSTAKTITWRIAAVAGTIVLLFALTGRITLALGFGMVDGVFKTILYYIHERAWDKVVWGRNPR